MTAISGRRAAFWGLLIVGLVVDQLVKAWARGAMTLGQAIPLPLPGVFELQLVYNQGIAFGLFQGKAILLAPIAVVITAGAIYYVYRHPNESRWNHAAYGLLAAGALGNLIDRIALGKVTDMFWFRLINFPVFNVADACISVATVMLFIGWWQESSRRAREEREAADLVPGETPARASE